MWQDLFVFYCVQNGSKRGKIGVIKNARFLVEALNQWVFDF